MKRKERIKTRDWNLVRLLQGATKAAIHIDKKKEANRDACREYDYEEDTGSGIDPKGGGRSDIHWVQIQDSNPSVYTDDPLGPGAVLLSGSSS